MAAPEVKILYFDILESASFLFYYIKVGFLADNALAVGMQCVNGSVMICIICGELLVGAVPVSPYSDICKPGL